ncbi:hypothetical protein K7472_10275 [Streptomyces sp. PTM05]|uniref:Uncharacterized protein n=1 Tax=Streptantibioticus parmotrematis TaxID=2873249 RepID=A0ABS7QPW0_9ACTN|nr:hypothetical protein [Streptantibioticus parmotrematis]MBY8885230.1 hypothetical protein [Streptantibioticus parmotrematis]
MNFVQVSAYALAGTMLLVLCGSGTGTAFAEGRGPGAVTGTAMTSAGDSGTATPADSGWGAVR